MTETYVIDDDEYSTQIRALVHDSGEVSLKIENNLEDTPSVRIGVGEKQDVIDILRSEYEDD